jgi:hypothetical protein
LKLLPETLKPLLSGGNNTRPIGTTSTTPTGTAPIGTAPTGTAPAGIITSSITDNNTSRTNISMDPYKLNKLNAGKPGFTKDKEIIIRHKFKYFRKNNKKN